MADEMQDVRPEPVDPRGQLVAARPVQDLHEGLAESPGQPAGDHSQLLFSKDLLVQWVADDEQHAQRTRVRVRGQRLRLGTAPHGHVPLPENPVPLAPEQFPRQCA